VPPNISKLDEVLGRAVRDPQFRRTLLDNPEQAAAEYNLSADEVDELKSIDKGKAAQFFGSASDEVSGQMMKDWCTDKTCYERG